MGSRSRMSEMGLYGEGIKEEGRYYDRHLRDDRGRNGSVLRGNGEAFRMLSQVNDLALPNRETGTSSRFQWNSLLNDSTRGRISSVREDVDTGSIGNYGRSYDGNVERTLPVESTRARNLPSYSTDVDVSEYGRRSRDASRVALEDRRNVLLADVSVSDYHGPSRDVTRIAAEESRRYSPTDVGVYEYHGQTRDTSRVRIEDRSYSPTNVGGSEYRGRARDASRGVAEDRYYSATDVGGSEYRRQTRELSRVEVEDSRNYLPIDVGVHHRRTRDVPRIALDDSRDYLLREREYHPHEEREPSRRNLDEDRGIRFHNEDSSRSLTPRSHSGGQYTPFRGVSVETLHQEGHRHPSDRVPSSRSNSYRRTTYSGADAGSHPDELGVCGSLPSSRLNNSYRHVPHSNATATNHPLLAEGGSYLGVEYTAEEGRPASYIHSENRPSREIYSSAVHEDHHVVDYHDQGDAFGNRAVGYTSPRRNSTRNYTVDEVIEDGLHNAYRTVPETPISNHYGGRGTVEVRYDEVNFHPRDTDPGHRRAEYLPAEEHRRSERDAHGVLYELQNVNISDRDITVDETRQRIMESEAAALHHQLKMTLKRTNGYASKSGAKRLKSVKGAVSYDSRQAIADNEREFRPSLKRINHHDEPRPRANAGTSINEAGQPFSGLSEKLQSRLSGPLEPGRGDLRKRLKYSTDFLSPSPRLPWQKTPKSWVKPSPHVIQATPSVVSHPKAKGASIKKTLNPAPETAASTPASQDLSAARSDGNIKKQQKRVGSDLDSIKAAKCVQESDSDRSIFRMKPSEKDLPENSDDFRVEVEKSFFRLMEYLNGEIGRQEKFKGQVKGGSLKCIICSSSNEFIEPKDVAMHAFTSTKVGYRTLHLGLHRALCVMMGWNTAVASNGRWICQSLPDHEAWNTKNDLIIWPPVVIIHNSPAENCHGIEPREVSADLLDTNLKDMGFCNFKVYHGNPGSLSTMVVKFCGTLSGLNESEKLHNFFAEKKRGRCNLQQIDSGVCSKRTDNDPADKMQDYQEPVDKKQDDQKPVDKNDSDHEPAAKNEPDQEPAAKNEPDQEPAAKNEPDQEPAAKNEPDQGPAAKNEPDQGPTAKNEPDQGPAAKNEPDQGPAVKNEPDQGPAVKSESDHEPLVKNSSDQELVVKSESDNEPVVMNASDQEPVVMNASDQEPVVMNASDQEPVVMNASDQEPVVKNESSQEPIVKGEFDEELADNNESDQGPAVKVEVVHERQMAEDDNVPVNTLECSFEPLKKAKCNIEPVHEAEYDEAPVHKAEVLVQEPIDKAHEDKEPSDKAHCDQEPIGKVSDPTGDIPDSTGQADKLIPLYGYLGIIEDLHKLHDSMKRHFRVKSKKTTLTSVDVAM